MFWLIIFLCILLPSCGSRLNRSFNNLQKQSERRIGAQTAWKQRLAVSYDGIAIHDGLSKQEAVSFALKHNPEVQAGLEELGIANSDLIQAGFYTNPRVDAIFRLPIKADATEIDINLNLFLSDLWQVPLRKKVAEDELEIRTIQILQLFLDTTLNTKKAYNNCLYRMARYKETKKIRDKVIELHNRIVYRKKFGFTNDFDIYFANVKVGEWEVELLEAKEHLDESFVLFRSITGLPISPEKIGLTSQLSDLNPLPPLESILQVAQSNKPELQVLHLKMRQACHEASYQKSRILDMVTIGFGYERDEEGNKGLGPSFGLKLPVFNWNTGNIKRAEYTYNQVEKLAVAEERAIQRGVRHLATFYETELEQIRVYEEKIIPSSRDAIEFAEYYFDTMQMSKVIALESYITLYKTKLGYLETLFNAQELHAELERIVSMRLEEID